MARKIIYCPIDYGKVVTTEELKQALAEGWTIYGVRSDPFGMMAGVGLEREEDDDGQQG